MIIGQGAIIQELWEKLLAYSIIHGIQAFMAFGLHYDTPAWLRIQLAVS